MAEQENVLDGFLFPGEAQYTRAKKEKEMIEYLKANTDSNDTKGWLKIYNKAVEKNSFQTVIGQQFLSELQKKLVRSGLVTLDTLAPIRAVSYAGRAEKKGTEKKKKATDADARVERYKTLYENAVADRKIKNMLIAVLICVIIGMAVITGTTKYSVFTYFTDYETKIREQVTDELQSWQNELEEREKKLEAREARNQPLEDR